MSNTIYFYNVFITKDGQKTTISVPDFLDSIIVLGEKNRFIKNSYGEFSMIEMLPPNNNYDGNTLDRVVGFAQYREKKPFSGQKGTDKRNEIKDDIFELTTSLFIPSYHLMVTEYNHFGARPNHIEHYLNSFLPIDKGWCIEFVPIKVEDSLNSVLKAQEIKSIEIKLDLGSYHSNLFEKIPQKIQSITSAISNVAGEFKKTGAQVATIVLGQGRKKEQLELKQILLLLEVLETESDAIASVKVKYIANGEKKAQEVNLKNSGILKATYANPNNYTAFETVAILISSFYYSHSQRIASGKFTEHYVNVVSAVLPTIEKNKDALELEAKLIDLEAQKEYDLVAATEE